jgi:hypothetical protein
MGALELIIVSSDVDTSIASVVYCSRYFDVEHSVRRHWEPHVVRVGVFMPNIPMAFMRRYLS